MSGRGPIRVLVFAVTAGLVLPLFAQHYQEHDHTVFHRPPPATQSKHHSDTAGSIGLTHAAPAASTTSARAAYPNRRHDGPSGTPPAATHPRTTPTPK